MARFLISRVASLVLSLLGAVVNFAVAAQLISFWRVLKWETESEWEGSADEGWRVDSIKLVWVLLSAYFSTASIVCVVGAIGVIKRNPSYVRLYRDYSVADVCFCGIFAVFTALASFRPGMRATVCEELSRQPELLRDLAEAGLSPENCEQWFEHAVVGFVGVTAILLVVRLQFILTVSNYYKQLLRQRLYDSIELCGSDASLEASGDEGSPRHIFLLPARSFLPKAKATTEAVPKSSSGSAKGRNAGVLVYAPVPLDSLSEEEAREIATSDAWVARPPSHTHSRRHSHGQSHGHSRSVSLTRAHRHGHAQSHSHSFSNGPGRISLPIQPNEGLLPPYTDSAAATSAGDIKV